MAIASRKQRGSMKESMLIPPMPWALTGIVSLGLVGLSGFWIAVIIRGWVTADGVPLGDIYAGFAGIILALGHVGLLAVAIFLRRRWAASTVVVLLALE